jgi:hypothetical protein
MLPIATIEKTEKTLEQTEKTLEQPVQGPNDSLLATAQLQASAATIATPIATTAKEAVKEEIKAVEGASEGSIKFAKVCGLIAKPLRSSSFTLRLTSLRMTWLRPSSSQLQHSRWKGSVYWRVNGKRKQEV